MQILKLVTAEGVLKQAGIDARAALGMVVARPAAHWKLVTPVSDAASALTSSRLYRSIRDQVDDDDKRRSFAVMINALDFAARHSDYQAVLKGSQVSVKLAHDFSHHSRQHKLWELKYQKKDRVYFCTAQAGAQQRPLIVLLLAHHKKDQTTPVEVIRYCEPTMKTYLSPTAQLTICQE